LLFAPLGFNQSEVRVVCWAGKASIPIEGIGHASFTIALKAFDDDVGGVAGDAELTER